MSSDDTQSTPRAEPAPQSWMSSLFGSSSAEDLELLKKRRRRADDDDDGDDAEETASEYQAQRELLKLEAAHRRRRACTWFTLLATLALLVTFIVLASYSTNRASRLWGHYVSGRTRRRFCLTMASVALDAPTQSPYGVGTLTMDAHAVVVDLKLILYGIYNATSMHIYGPMEPGSLDAPMAISLSSDMATDYVAAPSGSGRVHIRTRPIDAIDIENIYTDPALFYIGVSTAHHAHGTAVRFPLGGECNP